MNQSAPLDFPIQRIQAAHRRVMTIVGAIASTLFIYVIVVVIQAGVGKGPDSLSSPRTILLIAFIAAFLYDGITGSFENTRHLWVLIGLILAVDRIKE